MFRKINSTQDRPTKPVMVWDGHCGFCAFWIQYWQKLSKDSFDYIAYQELETRFQDIDRSYFKEAVRFIEEDGLVHSGPGAAYRSLSRLGKLSFLDRWYQKASFFKGFSDGLYQLIANNRSTFFRITKALFGSNPHNLRPFWAIYLFVLLYFLYL